MDEKTKALCLKININVVKILRLIIEKSWKILERLKIEKEDKENLDSLLKNQIYV